MPLIVREFSSNAELDVAPLGSISFPSSLDLFDENVIQNSFVHVHIYESGG
jgi:hypothetical protein